jgi:deoxyadenosine/deoxycytidine kinase
MTLTRKDAKIENQTAVVVAGTIGEGRSAHVDERMDTSILSQLYELVHDFDQD